MYRIIGGDQKPYGPVSADEIRKWIAEGRLNQQSLALPEGGQEWKSLGTFPEFQSAFTNQAGSLAAAAVPVTTASSAAYVAEILSRQPRLDIGYCLSQSWRLVTSNFGVLFGAAAVAWLLSLIQFIPAAGIVYWLLKGVVDGGLYLVFLRRIRNEPAQVSDVFSGFKLAFAQLLLTGLLTTLLSSLATVCCLLLPGIYLWVAWIFSVPLVADKRLEFWSAMELSRKVVSRVWFPVLGLILVAFLPFILGYLIISIVVGAKIWLPAISVLDSVLQSGHADFTRLGQAITHVVAANLLLSFLFKIVLLFNLPFAVGALMYAYESLFAPRRTPAT
jgi:hypothetical protein